MTRRSEHLPLPRSQCCYCDRITHNVHVDACNVGHREPAGSRPAFQRLAGRLHTLSGVASVCLMAVSNSLRSDTLSGQGRSSATVASTSWAWFTCGAGWAGGGSQGER